MTHRVCPWSARKRSTHQPVRAIQTPAPDTLSSEALSGATFHSFDVLAKTLDLVGHVIQLEHVVDPFEQLGLIHGLRKKVVGAGLDSTLDVTKLVECRDHQDHDVAC